ncbi:unnamed protein product [Withania somnifera]
MEMESKTSVVQIPVFGEWDKANDLPITQYFESARQAGLIRHSCHSSLQQNPFHHQTHFYASHTKTKEAINKKRCPKQKCTRKVEKGRKESGTMKSNDAKPVDEDLYKIPPHLLPGYKRKRMFGFLSRCLAPPCKA